MNVPDMIVKLFNGNETARSMRYSITVIIVLIIATYLGVLDRDYTQALILTVTGYIFGKARTTTVVSGKATKNTDDDASS